MKHYPLAILRAIPYPVGSNMGSTLAIVECMVENLIKACKAEFRDNKVINLLVTGSSGSILSGLMSPALIKEGYTVYICHVRKDGESSHRSHSEAERMRDTSGVDVVLDDFMCSGRTINRILTYFQLDTPYILCVSEVAVTPVLKHCPAVVISGEFISL